MHALAALFLPLLPLLPHLAAGRPTAGLDNPVPGTHLWTIDAMRRVCDAGDRSCEYSFFIKRGDGSSTTPCAYAVHGNETVPASHARVLGVTCGGGGRNPTYTVSSAWSGQFGLGSGFTTFAVVDSAEKTVAFPAYTDAQLAAGKVVTPDQSYVPQLW